MARKRKCSSCHYYFDSTTINFNTIQLTPYGQSDIFLAKYDSDGDILRAKKA